MGSKGWVLDGRRCGGWLASGESFHSLPRRCLPFGGAPAEEMNELFRCKSGFQQTRKSWTKQSEARRSTGKRSSDRTCLGRLWCIDMLSKKASLGNKLSHPMVGCSCCLSLLRHWLTEVYRKPRYHHMLSFKESCANDTAKPSRWT